MKKLFLVVFMLLATFSLCFAQSEEIDVVLNKQIKVMFNNEYQEFQNASGIRVYPLSYEGTTYLPIRSISSLFNSKIKWDGNTKSVYLGEGDLDTTSSKRVGAPSQGTNENVKVILNKDIKIYYNSKIQSFTDANGKTVYPLSYNGTTYLPVRAVSNLFDLKIDWDGKNNTIVIIKVEQVQKENQIAVVYFSVTGNTKTVAEFIKEELSASIFEIVPKLEYVDADLNYNDRNTRATKEQDDKNARPEIKNDIDVSRYDTVLLGYPIWWGDCPRIIQTFIETKKLNGKTVIPFCTSGSSGISGSENTLKTYKDINWMAGKRLTTSKSEVTNWVKSLNLNNASEKKEDNNLSSNTIKIEVNNQELVVKLEDNEATKELVQKLKSGDVVVNAKEYGGFEKVGSLGFSLTKDDKQIETKAGDIVLYQGNQISLFYNSNSWSYTKLGKVTNMSANELKQVLGNDDVTLTLKIGV